MTWRQVIVLVALLSAALVCLLSHEKDVALVVIGIAGGFISNTPRDPKEPHP